MPGIEIFLHRDVRRGADRGEHRQHLVLLDQFAGLLDRLGRRVGVVQTDEFDLAAVDAALVVEHLEIGGLGTRDGAVGRSRPAIGRGIAELDSGLGRARHARQCHKGHCKH